MTTTSISLSQNRGKSTLQKRNVAFSKSLERGERNGLCLFDGDKQEDGNIILVYLLKRDTSESKTIFC